MHSIPTSIGLYEGALRVLSATRHEGFCHHCERMSRWDDETFRYRCRECGCDPVEGADDTFSPVGSGLPDPLPPETAPRSRRWADRIPTPRLVGPSLWLRLGRALSPAH